MLILCLKEGIIRRVQTDCRLQVAQKAKGHKSRLVINIVLPIVGVYILLSSTVVCGQIEIQAGGAKCHPPSSELSAAQWDSADALIVSLPQITRASTQVV